MTTASSTATATATATTVVVYNCFFAETSQATIKSVETGLNNLVAYWKWHKEGFTEIVFMLPPCHFLLYSSNTIVTLRKKLIFRQVGLIA